MPPVSKAGAFLLVLVVTSSVLTLTTMTGVVAASSATTGGDTNDLDVVRKIKNSKKTNANANKDDTCTMEPFLGTSMYTNCKQEETEVKIACAKKGNAAADGTPTKKSCSYSEQPLQYEDAGPAATTAVGCGDHGFFDPETHLTRDHATGMCRLKFLRLTSTCVGAPASSGFGVMVEVPPSTGTGTGPGAHNHHEPNEDKNLKDNSGLLLRFSYDAGATYDNYEDPRNTVPLGRSSSRRMQFGLFVGIGVTLFTPTIANPNGACRQATGTFNGHQSNSMYAVPYETCFQYGDEAKYCFTKSYQCGSCGDSKYCTCTPNGERWKKVSGQSYDVKKGWLCGPACQGQHES